RPGKLPDPDNLAVRGEEPHLNQHRGLPMATADNKGFASRRQRPREDLGAFPADLGGDPLEIGVEGFREPLAGGLRSRGPGVPERLDPAPAPPPVLPENEVLSAAARAR